MQFAVSTCRDAACSLVVFLIVDLTLDARDVGTDAIDCRAAIDDGSQRSPEENEAIQSLERSVRLNPDFAASRAVLGKLLLRRNEIDRAITELEKALELDSQETSFLYQLAQAHRRKGNLERAKELFAKVDRAKSEERDKFMSRTLIRLVREGSK